MGERPTRKLLIELGVITPGPEQEYYSRTFMGKDAVARTKAHLIAKGIITPGRRVITLPNHGGGGKPTWH